MSAIRKLVEMIKEKRLGFSMDEVMSGYHKFEPGFGPEGQHLMEFRVTWSTRNALHVEPDRSLLHQLSGVVTVGGLCTDAPCRGTLALRYLADNTIRYDFTFEAAGKKYHYVGEKMYIWPWNLPWSHTTCYGRLTEVESGKLVSTSLTHFHLLSAPKFMASLRLN